MLNYVAGLLLDLPDLRQSLLLARHVAPGAGVPAGQDARPTRRPGRSSTLGVVPSRSASCSRVAVAASSGVLYARTRFGFEVQVIGDSPRAARYAGMRTRRKIVAVMCLSGAIAGLGGASQIGDFRHVLDAARAAAGALRLHGHRRRGARPLQPDRGRASSRSCSAGCQNAGYTLQGADFPSGLVGVMQGMILFCALGGELLVPLPAAARRGAPTTATRPRPRSA